MHPTHIQIILLLFLLHRILRFLHHPLLLGFTQLFLADLQTLKMVLFTQNPQTLLEVLPHPILLHFVHLVLLHPPLIHFRPILAWIHQVALPILLLLILSHQHFLLVYLTLTYLYFLTISQSFWQPNLTLSSQARAQEMAIIVLYLSAVIWAKLQQAFLAYALLV